MVPAASATGVGRNRPRRSASGVPRATIPAVAATLSWNPIAQTSQGSSTISTNTAPARIVPVERGRPISTPSSVSVAITPARITDGSAPVSTTKNTTVSIASRNRGHRVSPAHAAKARIGASTIATFSPETTSRWPSPVAWKSRASEGSSFESSPRTSPRSRPASRGGNSRSIERPTNARNVCVARTNGFGGGADPLEAPELQLRGHPLVCERLRESLVVGEPERALQPHLVAAHRGGKLLVAAHPHRLAEGGLSAVPDDAGHVHGRRPSVAAHAGIGPERPDRGDRARREPREQGAVDPGLLHPAPACAERDETDEAERDRAGGTAADPPCRCGHFGDRLRCGRHESRPLQDARAAACPGRSEPRPDDGRRPERQRHPRAEPG